MKTAIDKALKTWYEPDNPKYRDPLHPTLKLAGEVGKLLDLYAKHLFKPDFNWMQCNHCGFGDASHHPQSDCCPESKGIYTPIVLDKLGDIWYYLRILAWMNNVELSGNSFFKPSEILVAIKAAYNDANKLLFSNDIDESISYIFTLLITDLLPAVDCTLDQLTEQNYLKLNSESTNHGWKEAK